jgi:hypothetical protein
LIYSVADIEQLITQSEALIAEASKVEIQSTVPGQQKAALSWITGGLLLAAGVSVLLNQNNDE